MRLCGGGLIPCVEGAPAIVASEGLQAIGGSSIEQSDIQAQAERTGAWFVHDGLPPFAVEVRQLLAIAARHT